MPDLDSTPSNTPDVSDLPPKKKPRVSADDLYRRSTQYQIWSYTVDSLKEAKLQVNERGRAHAIEKFEKTKSKLAQEHHEIFQNHAQEFAPDKMIELLTLDEETRYLQFYCHLILETGNFFNMPTQVKATAISFFKKFFLVNSVMQYHPKHILYTVLFLAAKSENYFISIESFCKPLPKVEPKDILDLEFTILQSLKFTLLVHHPFRPLYGFFLDFQALLLHPEPVMYDVSIDTLGSLYDKAKTWLLKNAVLSDVPFLFTPPQIALAAMYDVDRRITDRYLKRKFLSDTHTEQEEEEASKKLETIDEEETPTTKRDPKKDAKKEKKDAIVKDVVPVFKTKEQEQAEEAERLRVIEQKEEDQKKLEEEKLRQRDQYETLVKTIRRCIKLAKQLPETSREESVVTDKKCFYTLNPNKLIKKKIKQLSQATDSSGSNSAAP